MKRPYCVDLPDDMPSCCGSCHEDVDYGFDLIEVELGGDAIAVVCCAVAGVLQGGQRPAADVWGARS